MNNEPVAWLWTKDGKPQSALLHEPMTVPNDPYWKDKGFKAIPLYTHPASLVDWSYQQGYQVGKETHPAKTLTDAELALSDVEISLIDEEFTGADGLDVVDFGRAILRKAQENEW